MRGKQNRFMGAILYPVEFLRSKNLYGAAQASIIEVSN